MATIAEILSRRWPGAQWVITGDDYATLQWLPGNAVAKPSEAEIRSHSAAVDAEMEVGRRARARVEAVMQDADRLFLALEILALAVDELQKLQPLATRTAPVDALVAKLAEIRSKVG
ncbi:MAG: hypothetical protein AB1830_13205 [Pseudomonadota bacterium]